MHLSRRQINFLTLSGFIIIKFVLQYLIIHPAFDLQRDEYLHIDQGAHLAWGYISVPPFTSWISAIIISLGKGFFWVKFFPALFGALTIAVAWKIVDKLGGNLYAQITCATALLLSSLLRINMLYQPNSLDIFWWTLVFYCSISLVKEGTVKWFYYLALSFAFGFLSKYNIVFLFLGLFPSMLLFTKGRILKNKHLYFSMMLAIMIILPNLNWQYANNFPTLHQLKELNDTQLVNVKIGGFLKDQVLYFINSLIILLLGFVAFIAKKEWRKYGFVLLTFFIVILAYLWLHAKPYYAIGLYPVILAAGAVYFEYLTRSKKLKFWLRPLMILFIAAGSIPIFLIAFPNKSPQAIAANKRLYKKMGMLRWEDGKEHNMPQDFADMLGWKELAKQVDSAFATISDKKNTLVFCDNYGEAGAINYYSRFPQINALSFNADYIYWIDTSRPIKNLIMVKKTPEFANDFLIKAKPAFDTAYIFAVNNNELSREYGRTVLVCLNAKADFRKYFVDKKNQYLQQKNKD